MTWSQCGSKVEGKTEKSLSPLRQKASVVPKSTLIWVLADPGWRKLVVKRWRKRSERVSWAILFTFAI